MLSLNIKAPKNIVKNISLVEIAEIVEVPIFYLNLQKMSIWVSYR